MAADSNCENPGERRPEPSPVGYDAGPEAGSDCFTGVPDATVGYQEPVDQLAELGVTYLQPEQPGTGDPDIPGDRTIYLGDPEEDRVVTDGSESGMFGPDQLKHHGHLNSDKRYRAGERDPHLAVNGDKGQLDQTPVFADTLPAFTEAPAGYEPLHATGHPSPEREYSDTNKPADEVFEGKTLMPIEAVPADGIFADPNHSWHAIRGFDFAGLNAILTDGLKPAKNWTSDSVGDPQYKNAICLSVSPVTSQLLGLEAKSFCEYTLKNGISLSVATEKPLLPTGCYGGFLDEARPERAGAANIDGMVLPEGTLDLPLSALSVSGEHERRKPAQELAYAERTCEHLTRLGVEFNSSEIEKIEATNKISREGVLIEPSDYQELESIFMSAYSRFLNTQYGIEVPTVRDMLSFVIGSTRRNGDVSVYEFNEEYKRKIPVANARIGANRYKGRYFKTGSLDRIMPTGGIETESIKVKYDGGDAAVFMAPEDLGTGYEEIGGAKIIDPVHIAPELGGTGIDFAGILLEKPAVTEDIRFTPVHGYITTSGEEISYPTEDRRRETAKEIEERQGATLVDISHRHFDVVPPGESSRWFTTGFSGCTAIAMITQERSGGRAVFLQHADPIQMDLQIGDGIDIPGADTETGKALVMASGHGNPIVGYKALTEALDQLRHPADVLPVVGRLAEIVGGNAVTVVPYSEDDRTMANPYANSLIIDVSATGLGTIEADGWFKV